MSIVSGNPLYSFQSTPSAWRETYISSLITSCGAFQSTPSAWRETYISSLIKSCGAFQSTPSAWRETTQLQFEDYDIDISIHSLRMEGDFSYCALCTVSTYFNPLPPHGGRRKYVALDIVLNDISIHSLRMEGDYNYLHDLGAFDISIHSLRMEGDIPKVLLVSAEIHFNPLPPHGGRLCWGVGWRFQNIFQSTPSAWRETLTVNSLCIQLTYFNPLPPHGGRPGRWRYTLRPLRDFNPLPPHGGRQFTFQQVYTISTFQSTPSAWRETCRMGRKYAQQGISIHSLRMEGDPAGKRSCRILAISIHSLRMEGDPAQTHTGMIGGNFNPLPPHGGRLGTVSVLRIRFPFQSTPSAWRETYGFMLFSRGRDISIHSLRMEGDMRRCRRFQPGLFQSTPSAWRETAKLHRKAFFISPILVQSCKKGCKILHSAPEKMVFFEKREKNLVRNLQHLSVRL